MTDVEETTPDEAEQVAPARQERRTVPAGAFVIAVLVAGALGVLAVFALASGGGPDAGGDDTDVRLAAGRFAERFLTYEHDDLDAWKQDVLALSTSGFAEEVEEVESGLRTLIAESQLDAATQVTDIFVGEVDRGAVDVVVVYDRELRGGGQGRTESDRYLQLAMVRIDGEWLVDNVIDIASAGDLGGPVAPVGEEPPTSAPPTSEAG